MAPQRDKKPPPDAGKWVLAAFLALAAPAQAEERALDLGGGRTLRYEVLEARVDSNSARSTALLMLGYLATGKIQEAAALSNAPARREEVLRDYQASVGEEEFRRVFAQYLDRRNSIVAEVAIGAHRLIVWKVGDASEQLAGQYYVEADGRFVLDDVPSRTRSDLQRVLQSYRSATPSGQKD